MNNFQINDIKTVRKAAQSVWAINKYFVLACDQNAYRSIRKYLRLEEQAYSEAFQLLKVVNDTYRSTQSAELPQISNTLYHTAGYFKKQLSPSERQQLNEQIPTDSAGALKKLQQLTIEHQIDYLLPANIWPDQRKKSFNEIPITIKTKGTVLPPYTSKWMGDYIEYHG